MKLFGRKSAARSAAGSAGSGKEDSATAAYRLTVSMARAEGLAAMMAHSRASNVVEVADLLAGLYISDWERLSQYWQPEKRDEVEDLLRRICGISPQRWHAWIEWYDREQHKGERRSIVGKLLRRNKKKSVNEQGSRFSASLQSVFKEAELFAPFHDKTNGTPIPILTSECVLLSIARASGSDIGQKLASAGLDTTKLERDALFPKRAPLL
jgi:hypothetical protein